MRSGGWGMGHGQGVKDREPEVKDRELGVKDREPGVKDREPGVKDREQRVKDREPGVKDREQRVKYGSGDKFLSPVENLLLPPA